ncbi:MAG: hypothetical protein K6F56_08405 [Oscillospiraceae bacterium]|nr:hypothetical protein [Oscillospiraceae bacterium]
MPLLQAACSFGIILSAVKGPDQTPDGMPFSAYRLRTGADAEWTFGGRSGLKAEKKTLFISYCQRDGNYYADELESQLSDYFIVKRDKSQMIANDDINGNLYRR